MRGRLLGPGYVLKSQSRSPVEAIRCSVMTLRLAIAGRRDNDAPDVAYVLTNVVEQPEIHGNVVAVVRASLKELGR